MSKKQKVARLSILSNLALVGMKLAAGMITGSVSILSEAIHSLMDLLAAAIAFFSVRAADRPPDQRHPYGHGKFENVSGVVEAVLIFIAAGWIIFEAISKLNHPGEVDSLAWGLAVMAISAIVNLLVSKKLYRVAKETDSIALEADALHLKTDVYTSAGVALGLLLILITDLHWLDPVVAMSVALLILWESIRLFKTAFQPLLDNSLPSQEIHLIEQAIAAFSTPYHDLRTRKSGSLRMVDFHIEVPGQISVKEAHELCDQIEEAIRGKFPGTEVTIHIENQII